MGKNVFDIRLLPSTFQYSYFIDFLYKSDAAERRRRRTRVWGEVGCEIKKSLRRLKVPAADTTATPPEDSDGES